MTESEGGATKEDFKGKDLISLLGEIKFRTRTCYRRLIRRFLCSASPGKPRGGSAGPPEDDAR